MQLQNKSQAYLFPQLQNLEPLKIAQILPLLPLCPLLRPRRFFPLLLYLLLLPRLPYRPSSCSSRQLLDHDGGEDNIGERCRVSGYVGV